DEVLLDVGEVDPLERTLGQRVLDDAVLDARLAQARAELRHALDREPREVREVHGVRRLELLGELRDRGLLLLANTGLGAGLGRDQRGATRRGRFGTLRKPAPIGELTVTLRM